ncbi:MAG: hypothetical protein OEM59_03660 [Rhodospirillales bacterium]|nr:hypothetical protein [Rhodospirillales bacterium]
MEDYESDLPPQVVVAWSLRAVREGESGLLAGAWHEDVAEDGFRPEKGGYEETEVREVTAVGSLEAVPEHRPDRRTLGVRVEDELGARIPGDEDAPEGPEEIALGEFWEEFVAPGRGAASIWVSAADAAGKQAFDRFVAGPERAAERHGEE